MVARFTEIEMLRLAEIYKDYDCLWNVRSCFYKNRDSREIAYKEIWRQLNVPGLSIKDIPIKIKNLRTSYHQELKKIDISVRSGAGPDSVYKPKVSWFDIVDGYLNPSKSKRHTQDNEIQSNASDYNSDTEQNDADEMFEEKYNPAEAPHLLESSHTPETREQIDSRSRRGESIHEAIERLDRVAEQLTRGGRPRAGEDEFDSFGKYLASALRALPAEAAIMARTELQKTLSHIQLRAMRHS